MAGYAFPHAAGVKLAGSNLCIRRADIDAYNRNNSTDAWYLMLYDWGKGIGAVRESWILPQLNALQSLGANCVRLIMSPRVRVGNLPTLSETEWFTVLDEFAADCAERNLWWYVTLADAWLLNQNVTFGINANMVASYVMETIDRTNRYSNVLGFDLVQEITRDGTSTFAYSNMATWFAAAKAARSHSDRKVTCSYYLTTGGREEYAPSHAWPGIEAAGAEVRDIHIYGQPQSGWLDELLKDKAPLFIGESGIQEDGSYTGAAKSTPRAHYEVLAKWSGEADLQGVLTWAVVNPTNGWGMFEDTQGDDFAFTTPRPDKVSLFKTFKKAIQPRKGGDRGPIIAGLPAVMRNEGAIDVSWRLAEGGSGARVYVPQYVEDDGHGFPKADWSSAPATAGRNALITGLDPYAAYLLRVQVSDSDTPPVTNYSSWQFAAADPPRRVFFVRR